MFLYFLGTGAGRPSRRRNVTSIALGLPDPEHDIWLFDCGEGTQHQMLRSPLRLHKISRIFITHLHGDHIFGLPGLLSSRSFLAPEQELNVYGPKGITSFLENALKISSTHLSYPLYVNEIEPGDSIKIDAWTIKIALLDHGLPSFGYRVEEPAKLGKLNIVKLQALKIPPGPIYGDLKQGKTITLEDGQILKGTDFTDPEIPGRQVVILCDTRYCPGAIKLAKNADLLVHEATFASSLQEKATKYNHSTTTQAAQIAKQANVKRLVLTHLSSRYNVSDQAELLAEARSLFANTILAEDHLSVHIPRN